MSTLFAHFFQKINGLSPLEHTFTEKLNTIALMPKMLYFYGKMPENIVINGVSKRPKCVAIVGSRHNSRYGEEVTYKLSYELARRGVVIISGLAIGIDAISHRAALDAGGKTVAILGTAIDNIYPRQNQGLANEILEKGGCIISEYAPGAKTYFKTSFLERNRLISGLADVVIITEAAERSGTLNTATHALEQGRDLLVVPGDITKPLSVGCNRLIRQGAMPLTEIDDVLNLLFPTRRSEKPRLIAGDTPTETAILKLLSEGVRDGEDIMAKLKLPVTEFNQIVTLLEIKGLIRGLGANNWVLR